MKRSTDLVLLFFLISVKRVILCIDPMSLLCVLIKNKKIRSLGLKSNHTYPSIRRLKPTARYWLSQNVNIG